jgi:hypothetical protein
LTSPLTGGMLLPMLATLLPTGVTTNSTSPSSWLPMVNTATAGRSVEPRL